MTATCPSWLLGDNCAICAACIAVGLWRSWVEIGAIVSRAQKMREGLASLLDSCITSGA